MNQQCQKAILGQNARSHRWQCRHCLETARAGRVGGCERHPHCAERQTANRGRDGDRAQRTASFDANDTFGIGGILRGARRPIDHVMVTAGGPAYGPCSK